MSFLAELWTKPAVRRITYLVFLLFVGYYIYGYQTSLLNPFFGLLSLVGTLTSILSLLITLEVRSYTQTFQKKLDDAKNQFLVLSDRTERTRLASDINSLLTQIDRDNHELTVFQIRTLISSIANFHEEGKVSAIQTILSESVDTLSTVINRSEKLRTGKEEAEIEGIKESIKPLLSTLHIHFTNNSRVKDNI